MARPGMIGCLVLLGVACSSAPGVPEDAPPDGSLCSIGAPRLRTFPAHRPLIVSFGFSPSPLLSRVPFAATLCRPMWAVLRTAGGTCPPVMAAALAPLLQASAAFRRASTSCMPSACRMASRITKLNGC